MKQKYYPHVLTNTAAANLSLINSMDQLSTTTQQINVTPLMTPMKKVHNITAKSCCRNELRKK